MEMKDGEILVGERLARAIADMGITVNRAAKLAIKPNGSHLSQTQMRMLISFPPERMTEDTEHALSVLLSQRCPHCGAYRPKEKKKRG